MTSMTTWSKAAPPVIFTEPVPSTATCVLDGQVLVDAGPVDAARGRRVGQCRAVELDEAAGADGLA